MNALDDGLDFETRVNPYGYDANDRVAIFLDVRNITSKLGTNTKADFAKIRKDVLNGRKCVAAYAVDGVQYDERGKDVDRDFHRELRRAGFRVDLVKASNNKGKQEGVDMRLGLLALDLVKDKVCNVVELITGDGDFHVLVSMLQYRGAVVNVSSFHRSLSYLLGDTADNVRILDNFAAVKMEPRIREVA